MEVDLFIHGVPHGWDFWGLEAERSYFGNFYKPHQAARELVLETRQNGGRTYIYYHYLRGTDITDYEARDGSYVGVTVRLDAYCRHPYYVWLLLDRLFDRHLQQLLFEAAGTKLKWRIPTLRQADKALHEVQSQLLGLMGKLLQAADFAPIDATFATKASGAKTLGMADATDELVGQCLRQCGRVAIAAEYAADRERQAQAQARQQLSAMQARAEQTQREWQQRLHEAEQQQAALSQQVRTQQSEMIRLQQQLHKAEQNLLQARSDAAMFGNTTDSGWMAPLRPWLPYICGLLMVAVIVLTCLLACNKGEAPYNPPEGDRQSTDSATVVLPTGGAAPCNPPKGDGQSRDSTAVVLPTGGDGPL